MELLAVEPDTPLPVEHGAPVIELDCYRGDGEDGACECEADARGSRVEHAVHRVPSAFGQTAGTPKRR